VNLLLTQPTDANESHHEPTGAERRRGLRISQDRPIKVFEPSAGRYIGGKTHDVSATGLRLEVPASAPLRPGKVLNVHVGLSYTGASLANRRQMIPARVVWVNREIGDVRRMCVGVEFMSSIAAHLDAA
jgi:hypothetical protein